MSAAQEYKRVLTDLLILAERIPGVLAEHAKQQAATPTYWTHVADLKKARLDLLHTLAFLGDVESKERLLGEGESR